MSTVTASSATVSQHYTEARIICDSRFTAEALASAMLDALHAVSGEVPGALAAASKLYSVGKTIYIPKGSRRVYAAMAGALAVAIEMDETLPEVTL